jgi:hypothetical protein
MTKNKNRYSRLITHFLRVTLEKILFLYLKLFFMFVTYVFMVEGLKKRLTRSFNNL